MAIIVILCGAPHLYKKDMNNSGLIILNLQWWGVYGKENRQIHE
jgi:hypothetical protein